MSKHHKYQGGRSASISSGRSTVLISGRLPSRDEDSLDIDEEGRSSYHSSRAGGDKGNNTIRSRIRNIEPPDEHNVAMQSVSVANLCSFVTDMEQSLLSNTAPLSKYSASATSYTSRTSDSRLSFVLLIPKDDTNGSTIQQRQVQQEETTVHVSNFFVTVAWTNVACAAQIHIQQCKQHQEKEDDEPCSSSDPLLVWPARSSPLPMLDVVGHMEGDTSGSAMKSERITAVETLVICESESAASEDDARCSRSINARAITYPKLLPYRISIVVGTSHGQVFASEFQVLQTSSNAAELLRVSTVDDSTNFASIDSASDVTMYHQPLPLMMNNDEGDPGKPTQEEQGAPLFHPGGGVQSIQVYHDVPTPTTSASETIHQGLEDTNTTMAMVWVTYGDTTMVRLPQIWFFPSCCDSWLGSQVSSVLMREKASSKHSKKAARREHDDNKSPTSVSSWLMPAWAMSISSKDTQLRAAKGGRPPTSPSVSNPSFARNSNPQTSASRQSATRIVPLPVYHPEATSLLPPNPPELVDFHQAISYGDAVSSLTLLSSVDTSPDSGFDIVSYQEALLSEAEAKHGTNSGSKAHPQGSSISGSIMGAIGSTLGWWSATPTSGKHHVSMNNNVYTSSKFEDEEEDEDSDDQSSSQATSSSDEEEASLDDKFHDSHQNDDIHGSASDSSSSDGGDAFVSATHCIEKTYHKRRDGAGGPRYLIPQTTLLDLPRKILSVAIDPSGHYAAVPDTLGRVMLLDLKTHQIVRIWKGVRDARCYWIHAFVARPSIDRQRSGGETMCYQMTQCRYLIIHAKQRQAVEVWSIPQGTRVAKMDNVEDECRIVPCRMVVQRRRKKDWSGGGHHLQHDDSSNCSSMSTLCFIVYPDDSAVPIKVPHILDHEPIIATDKRKIPLPHITTRHDEVPRTITSASSVSEQRPAIPATATVGVPSSSSKSNKRGPAIHLQMLKQLLSTTDEEEGNDGNGGVPPTPASIHDSLAQFHSMLDLSDALHLVAITPYKVFEHLPLGLQQREALDFHSSVVQQCRESLDEAIELEAEQQLSLSQSDHGIDMLRLQLQRHTQIMEAFACIQKFETDERFGVNQVNIKEKGNNDYDEDEDDDNLMLFTDADDNNDENGSGGQPRTPWAVEALSWIDRYEDISNQKLTSTVLPSANVEVDTPLRFSAFYKVCCMDQALIQQITNGLGLREERLHLSLIDSTRDRVATLTHIFRPLLKDVFVSKAVNSIFNHLGLGGDSELERRQHYFGEWFMSLDARQALKSSLYEMWCPILRWLQELISTAYDVQGTGAGTGTGSQATKRRVLPLERLYAFCQEASDLPRAFLLAVVCREAVAIASKQKEAKTYGAVSSKDAVAPWDSLLRKLRVCLIFTLRLYSENLGPIPVSIQTIEEEKGNDVFSVFQWIARDELTYAHKQGDISSFEQGFSTILTTFDPSLPEGDVMTNVKLIVQTNNQARNENECDLGTVLKTREPPWPLLCYFSQFNRPTELAAHRALLLADKWGREPASLHLLKDSVSALRSLKVMVVTGGGHGSNKARTTSTTSIYNNNIAMAVRVEVWQSRIRPVYRALLFGFDDVPELPEEDFLPLIMKEDWLRSLSRIASEVVSLIRQTPTIVLDNQKKKNATKAMILKTKSARSKSYVDMEEDDDENEDEEAATQHLMPWPSAPNEDTMLSALIQRTRLIQPEALEIHRGIICAVQLAESLNSLALCAPSLGDVFSRHSLFTNLPQRPVCTSEQVVFLQGAVLRKAREAKGTEINRVDLEDVESLGKAWGFSASKIRCDFILAVYRCGKDYMVGDLALSDLSATSTEADRTSFVEECTTIAAFRINSALTMLKKVKQFRGIMSMLDADTCRWVKEQAEVEWSKVQSAAGGGGGSFNANTSMPSLSATHELVLRMLRMASSLSRNDGSQMLSEQAHSLSVLSGTLLKAVQDEDNF
jgi:hypothetical protein